MTGSQWLKTALLGLGAGIVASLLFIASQLVTSSTALEDKGVKTLVVLVTVGGFIAGITFDALQEAPPTGRHRHRPLDRS